VIYFSEIRCARFASVGRAATLILIVRSPWKNLGELASDYVYALELHEETTEQQNDRGSKGIFICVENRLCQILPTQSLLTELRRPIVKNASGDVFVELLIQKGIIAQ